MNRPTSANIRAWSKLDFSDPDLGYLPASPDPLDFVVAQACGYVTQVTARAIDATMPTDLLEIAQAAILRRAEQLIQMGKADNVDTAGDVDLVSSFTAGSYSETRRDTSARQGQSPATLNPWPELDRALWLLLTDTPAEAAAGGNAAVEERRDYWRWLLGQGSQLPAWQIVETDWSNNAALSYGVGYGTVGPWY